MDPIIWIGSRNLINQLAGSTLQTITKVEMVKWLSLMTGSITVDNNTGYLHQPCIDRTNSIKMPFNFDTSNYFMPELVATNDSFQDVCVKRCQEIVSIAEKHQKKILIMYSGGVDSTCIICAFIIAYGIKYVKDNIVICMNDDSIDENQNFYNKVIKNNMQIISSNNFNVNFGEKEYEQYIIVNGDPGGALEGGGVLRTMTVQYNEAIDSKNWKDQIRKYHSMLFYRHPHFKCNYEDYFIDSIEITAKSRNVVIENLFDCFWWYLINFKWMAMSLNIFYNCAVTLEKRPYGAEYWRDHMIPFFSTDLFTLWSFSNKHNLLKLRVDGTPWPKYYKKHFKDVIYHVHSDADYYNNKGKDARLINAVKKDHLSHIPFLTNDFKTT